MKNEALRYLDSLVTETTTKRELDLLAFIKKCVRECNITPQTQKKELETYIEELYTKFYSIYIRKGSKIQGLKTFKKKLIKLKTKEEILEKARKIGKLYLLQAEAWKREGTEKKYIPLVSSWLNANVPD